MYNKIIQRAVKDYKLPLNIFEEPYFMYYVDLYDKFYGIRKIFGNLQEILNHVNTEEEFLDYYETVMNKIVETVKKTSAYQDFISMDMKKYSVSGNYPKGNLYSITNNFKTFISVDLVKANYQALKFVNPEIVLNSKDYSDFISKFASFEYLKNSKYLRQVIFGNLNPKRQTTVERFMIQKVLEYLVENNYVSENNITNVVTDEMIFSSMKEVNLKLLEREIKEKTGVEVHFEKFKLKALISPKDNECYGFVKEFLYSTNGETIAFKAVNSEYFPQVFKYYYGLPVDEKDLVFFHNGKKAKFLEGLF